MLVRAPIAGVGAAVLIALNHYVVKLLMVGGRAAPAPATTVPEPQTIILCGLNLRCSVFGCHSLSLSHSPT